MEFENESSEMKLKEMNSQNLHFKISLETIH